MELTSALKHRTYEGLARPMTSSGAPYQEREYLSPPSYQTQGARKITLNDWNLHNVHLSTTGVNLRNDSQSTSQKAHADSDEVKLRTQRNQTTTTSNLGQRITHIERSRDNLNVANDLVDNEIRALEQVKADTEQMLRDMTKPLNIAKQCLQTRDKRRKTDSVRDKPEDELLKEVKLIERICGSLQNKIAQCFNQLAKLRSARAKITSDKVGKSHAHNIDSTCQQLSNLNGKSSYIYNYSRNRTTLGSTPASWTSFSNNNCNIGDAEREMSRSLREQANTLMNASNCDLKAQNNQVDSAIRVRVNQMEQAKSELQYNRSEMLVAISNAEREIENLKKTIHGQVKPLQVAQTRFSNREDRPNIEYCHDHVESGIRSEIHALSTDIQNMEYQLERVHERRQELRLTLSRIEDDLSSKMFSLELDNQCLQMRSS